MKIHQNQLKYSHKHSSQSWLDSEGFSTKTAKFITLKSKGEIIN